MASGIQTTPIFKKMVEILDDQKGVEILLSYPRQDLVQHLTERQKALWSMVVSHCGNSLVVDDFEDEENEVNDLDKPSSKRRRVGPKRPPGPRDQMEVLTNLTSIGVPEPYRRHIEKHGTDPAQFLNDKGSLIHQVAEPNYDEADLHLAVMRYTLKVQSRTTKDRARWLFHMLLYFDLAKLKHPEGTGRIGDRMKEEIWELVKDRVDDPESNALPLDELSTWSTQGKKLNVFCKEFGIGSLFVLEEYLSNNFLKKRFSHTGEYHVNAFENLHQRGLKETAELSKLNELGEHIRAYLIEPFRRAHLKQLFEKGVSSPSTSKSSAGKMERRLWSKLSLSGTGGTR